MKKYFFALALVLSVGAHAFEVSGNHFEGKFKIDSMTVGENEVTVNASSAAADVGQYGKVYVSYTFTQNPYIPNSVPGKDMEEAWALMDSFKLVF